MEAKETRILKDEVTFCNKDMDEQAEISFKVGIKEVIDWLEAEHKQHEGSQFGLSIKAVLSHWHRKDGIIVIT